MSQDRRFILVEPVRQKQRHTVRRQHLNELMQDALGHGQRAGAHIDDQQQLALRVYGRPDPGGRTLQALDRLVVADQTGGEVPQHRVQLVELQLFHVHVTEEIGRKGSQLLRCFHQPVQNRIGIDPKDAGGGPNASALRQARQHVHDQFHRRLFTMKNRAMMFGEIAVT